MRPRHPTSLSRAGRSVSRSPSIPASAELGDIRQYVVDAARMGEDAVDMIVLTGQDGGS